MNISQPSGLSKKHPDESLAAGCIASAKKGDKAAFEWLVKHYRNQMAAVAFKMTGDYEAAQDITQEVFLKVKKASGDMTRENGSLPGSIKLPSTRPLTISGGKKDSPAIKTSPGMEHSMTSSRPMVILKHF